MVELKYEEVYLKAYGSIAEARRKIGNYFELTIGGGIKALTTEHQMWFTSQYCPRKRQQPEQEQLITQKTLFTVQTISTTAVAFPAN